MLCTLWLPFVHGGSLTVRSGMSSLALMAGSEVLRACADWRYNARECTAPTAVLHHVSLMDYVYRSDA